MVADFYGRKSTKDDGRSVTSQENEFRADCTDSNLIPGRVFADPDRSASRYAKKDRPDYLALLEHIRSGNCQLLSMWESSRGSRDLGDWVTFLDLCRKTGTLIRVISHGRTYDVRVRRDWRTLADEGVDSADESEKISERVRRGHRLSAKEGRPTARLAFGFIRIYDERGKFVEQIAHPEQAPIVREIIGKLAEGVSAGGIARSLNQRGVPTPQRVCAEGCDRDHKHFYGGQWTDKQVRTVAVKPSYAGLRVHQGRIVGKGCWEPIVDPDRWQTVNTILNTPGRKAVDDTRLTHWLTGAVFCGLCDGRFIISNREWGKAYRCRECHRVTASARQLEAFVEPLVLDRLGLPDATDLFVPAPDQGEISETRWALDRLTARLAEFRAEAAKPEGMSAATIAEAERGLAPKIEALEIKLRRLTKPAALAGLEGVDVVGTWHELGIKVRREIVAALARIVLTPGSRSGSKMFDPMRLAQSRWTGDHRTWGEIWAMGA